MAVLRAPKQKKQHRVGWNSHAVELYTDSSDSWSFPATRGAGSSVKQRVVHLPVSPRKKPMNPGGTNNHIPLDYDNDIQPYSYHLNLQAYALAMAGDMEDATMAPRKQVYTHWNGDYFDKTPLQKLGLRYQLQRAWLFPGTVMEPCIAVTVAALEQFQMLTFMGKVLAYKYYHSLAQLSDNTGTKTPPDNFEAFICIVREWSFIRLLKRAEISNNTSGWEVAKLASCAVECLACPRPGINIPVKSDPDLPMAWEDTLFVSVDTNFKLERFEVSSEEKDPGLGQALSYFVDTKAFKDHLINFDKRIIQLQSTCNDHEAAKGDKKTQAQSRALAASGVGGVVCTCHELKLPLSMVDLRVGKTQVEMDYGYLSAVKQFSSVPWIVTTYDIACQWSINLEDRIKVYGPNMAPPLCNMLYLIPKFHLPGYIKACQEKYYAVPNAAEFKSHFEQFTTTLPTDDVAKWTAMVEAWEADREQFNPFARIVASKSEAAMCLQLACEDVQDELAGLEGDQLYVMSPKDMIAQGVQIETSQRRIARMNKELGEHSTDLQRAQVLEKSNRLCRRVESWFVQQEVHMPVVHGLRIRDSKGNGPSVPAYSQPLYLPSTVLLHHPCDDIVIRAEARLHIGQGFDLLHTIHGHLLALAKGYKDADATMLTQKEWLKCHKTTRDLNDSDVRRIADSAVGAFDMEQGMSWIWYAAHLGDVPGSINEFGNQACRFENRMVQGSCMGTSLEGGVRAKSGMEGGAFVMAREGAAAYAKCQAAIRIAIKSNFEHKWCDMKYSTIKYNDKTPDATDVGNLGGVRDQGVGEHAALSGNNVIIFTVIAFAIIVNAFWIFRKSLPEPWKTGFQKYVDMVCAGIIKKPAIYVAMPAFENQFKSCDRKIYFFFYSMNALMIILPLCAITVDHKNWQTISVSISMALIQLGLMADKLQSLKITSGYDSQLQKQLRSQATSTSSSDHTGNQGIVARVDPDDKEKASIFYILDSAIYLFMIVGLIVLNYVCGSISHPAALFMSLGLLYEYVLGTGTKLYTTQVSAEYVMWKLKSIKKKDLPPSRRAKRNRQVQGCCQEVQACRMVLANNICTLLLRLLQGNARRPE
ncbi:hypothetical protein IW262DRAFT_1301039 [Armillaria fumosa]|nr:hypothetical protein IW262DRAFT_1301039 [Armillaria fumosa]